MVESQFAHSVRQGCLRIGTFEGYRELENGRADAADGAIEVVAQALMPGLTGHDIALKRLGFSPETPVIGSRFTFRVPPAYVLCLTRVGNRFDPQPDKPKTMFQVADVERLARRLQQVNHSRLGRFQIAEVAYARREFDALEHTLPPPHPFVKGERFAPEQEIRIIWRPRGKAPVEPFVSQQDRRVGALLSEIAS